MSSFSEEVKRRLEDAGIPQAELAREAHIHPSYLSHILSDRRTPPDHIAQSIDTALNAHGSLAALLHEDGPSAEMAVGAPMDDADLEQLRATIGHLVELDTMHGSSGLYINAARAFRNAHRKLSVVGARPDVERDLQVTIAEVGEVASWLAYDGEEHDTSRHVAAEALLVARLAGDTSMERFLQSHLSMQATYLGRGAEALQIADRIIAQEPKSRRVVGMMRVRRARALGVLGDQPQALAELAQARDELAGGVGPGDPGWTWWLNEAEMAVHEARIRSKTGDTRGAVAWSEKSVLALPQRQGRDQALYRAWLVSDLVDAHAWREAELVAEHLVRFAGVYGGTERVPRILRKAQRRADRDNGPRWVVDALAEAATATVPAA